MMTYGTFMYVDTLFKSKNRIYCEYFSYYFS